MVMRLLPPAMSRPHDNSVLSFRRLIQLSIPANTPSVSLFQLTTKRALSINCASRNPSDCSCWEGLSEEKKSSFSKVFEEFRTEIRYCREAQAQAEVNQKIDDKHADLLEQELARLREANEMQLQVRKDSLCQKLLFVRRKRTRLLADKGRLSFEKLFCMNFMFEMVNFMLEFLSFTDWC